MLDFYWSDTGRSLRVKDWQVPPRIWRGVRCEFPSSKILRTSLCHRLRAYNSCSGVGTLRRRPRPPFRRHPAKDGVIPKARMFGPLLGHDDGGDCSPEDHSSLGLRLTVSDRPLSDAALVRGHCRRRGQRSWKALSFRLPLDGGSGEQEPWVNGYGLDFPLT